MATSSQSAASAKLCAVCQKPGTRCVGCIEGLDVNGQLSPTYYCGKICQKAHRKTHKQACSDANDRKILYRAGEVLQTIFYIFREIAFDVSIANATTTKDGLIHLYEGHCQQEQLLVPFPKHIEMSEDVKKAVLAHNTCDEALIHMHVLAKKLLDLCDEITELVYTVNNGVTRTIFHHADGTIDAHRLMHQVLFVTLHPGEEYIIDLAGAQYKDSAPVKTYEQYSAEYIAAESHYNSFGNRAIRRQKEIRNGDSTDPRTQVLMALETAASSINESVTIMENGAQGNLPLSPLLVMLMATQPEYQAMKDVLVNLAKCDVKIAVADMDKKIADKVKTAQQKANDGDKNKAKTDAKAKHPQADSKGHHTYVHGDELPNNVGSQEFLENFMKHGGSVKTLF